MCSILFCFFYLSLSFVHSFICSLIMFSLFSALFHVHIKRKGFLPVAYPVFLFLFLFTFHLSETLVNVQRGEESISGSPPLTYATFSKKTARLALPGWPLPALPLTPPWLVKARRRLRGRLYLMVEETDMWRTLRSLHVLTTRKDEDNV